MAKKKSNEEKIRRGLEELRRSGLSLDEASPALITRLQEFVGKGTEADLAVVFALGKIADPAAVKALAAIEKNSTDKEVKQEVRRSLFKLSQRGLAIPREENLEAKTAASLFARAPDV